MAGFWLNRPLILWVLAPTSKSVFISLDINCKNCTLHWSLYSKWSQWGNSTRFLPKDIEQYYATAKPALQQVPAPDIIDPNQWSICKAWWNKSIQQNAPPPPKQLTWPKGSAVKSVRPHMTPQRSWVRALTGQSCLGDSSGPIPTYPTTLVHTSSTNKEYG